MAARYQAGSHRTRLIGWNILSPHRMSPLMAPSGHTETIRCLSAFGQKRTYMLA
jgi:hypothetical protein